VQGYEIISELGRGGMGVVYKARQVKLNRVVALKMIVSGAHAGETDLARFRTEAEAIARLQHPNIVQIYEVNEQGGLPYFSLEFCAGGSLERKLNGTPLPPREAAQLVETLARAMAAAHQKGVIHRDLKPANVLLAEDGTPKITDFGLAKKLDEAGRTASGAVLGTPSYMAPEQAGGKNREVGPPADVYALGAILYECLTGRPPFRAATALDTLMQVVADEPVPPTQLQSKTPRDLETITLKCLQKDPRGRYGSAQALADDLGRYLKGEPIQARPVGPAERLWRWCQRNWAVAALLALAGTLLVLLAAVMTGAYIRTSAALERSNRHLYLADMHLAQVAMENGEHGRLIEILDKHVPAGRQTDLRGWEWYYLRARCPLLFSLPGRDVYPSAWSPDGRRLALSSNNRSISVWDATTGKNMVVLPDNLAGVGDSVAWSPDGQRLAAARLTAIKIWDVNVGRMDRVFRGHSDTVRSVSWHPDGQQLASGSNDKTVRVWNVATGEEVLCLRGHDAGVSVSWGPDGRHLASADGTTVKVWDKATGKKVFASAAATRSWSRDGRVLATGGSDGTITIWDATTGRKRSWRGHHGRVWFVSLSPDAKRLASETPDMYGRLDHKTGAVQWEDQLKLWDVATGQEIHTRKGFTGHREEVSWRGCTEAASWSPDGKRIATANGWVSVWDAKTGRELFTLRGHKYAKALAWSPDGKRLASEGTGQAVKVWDTAPAQAFRTLRGHKGSVAFLAWSPDGQRLVSVESRGETIKLWNTGTGRELFSMHHSSDGIPRETGGWHPTVSWAPDGKQLATTGKSNTIKVWDPTTGKEARSLAGHTQRVWWAAWSPDSQRLASASEDRTVRVWNAATGEQIDCLCGHGSGVESVAWSPDGGHLASSSFDGTIRVWDVRTGRVDRVINVRGQSVWERLIAWSPDGTKLASASEESSVGARTITVWNLSSENEKLTIQGHTGVLTSVCWSPDAKRLASASRDGTIKLWDPVTGQEAMALQVGGAGVFCVAWSQDGQMLASATADGAIQIWDAARGYQLAK
jgi:WD40 repeat protein/tRNA A-37 threonylcarbamoyl transferase component Bud32